MRTAQYQIEIDGTDVSNAFDPLLISLSVKLDDKGTSDELSIELDDSYGQIQLPTMGAQVTCLLGWDDEGVAEVFVGTVDTAKSGGGRHPDAKHHGHHKKHHHGHHDEHDEHHHEKHHHDAGHGGGSAPSDGEGLVHSTGSRSKGRTLTITAKSADMTSKVKARATRHMDNASFSDVATAWGQNAGLTVQVDSALSAIQRPYWSMANESFMSWGSRMAIALGATFKIFGTQAVFVSRSGGQSASGQDLEDVDVTWGDNLIEWSISPILSRPDYGTFGTRWYDPQAATWNTETSSASASSSSVTHTHDFKAPAKDHASKQSGANATESGREKGGGDSVVIDGEPAAMPSANCNVSGIRPGVDGTYLISEVTHSLSRHAGFTTHLTLKQPAGGAGTDSRQAGSDTST